MPKCANLNLSDTVPQPTEVKEGLWTWQPAPCTSQAFTNTLSYLWAVFGQLSYLATDVSRTTTARRLTPTICSTTSGLRF